MLINNLTLKRPFLSLALSLSICGIFSHSAFSSDLIKARTPHNQNTNAYVLANEAKVSRIIVKFHEGTGIRLRSNALVVEQLDNTKLSRIIPKFNESLFTDELNRMTDVFHQEGYQIQSLFKKGDSQTVVAFEQQLAALKSSAEQRSQQEVSDLRLYYEVLLPEGTTYAKVMEKLAFLNNLSTVEIAYVEPQLTIMKSLPNNAEISQRDVIPTPNFEPQQGYLNDPPSGIGAKNCAWSELGGRGKHINVVDVEMAWNTAHEDLPSLFYTYGSPINDFYAVNHGTAVLGTIAAVNNGIGTTGIISDAKIGYASVCLPEYGEQCFPYNGSEPDIDKASLNVANAIWHATMAVEQNGGGIVLIELQFPGPTNSSPCTCNKEQCNAIPVEYWPAIFDVIEVATLVGVVVVEAAGNGSSNLDDPVYEGRFDRTVRDSGAILVAASGTTLGIPACYTNWGSRIDLHSWGANIATLGGYGLLFNGGNDCCDNRYYTFKIEGTSGASPIVVGAVGSVQSIAIERYGKPLSPLKLRDLLVKTGTPAQSNEKKIGPQPNLCQLIPMIKEGKY